MGRGTATVAVETAGNVGCLPSMIEPPQRALLCPAGGSVLRAPAHLRFSSFPFLEARIYTKVSFQRHPKNKLGKPEIDYLCFGVACYGVD